MDIRKHTVPDFQGRDTTETVIPKIQAILDDIKNRGVFYVARRDCLTGYGDTEFYDWDLYFETLFLSHFGISRFCRNNVELFLDTQNACGFVSRTYREPRHRHQFKPFLAQTALLGARQEQNFRWLDGRYYDSLKKYLDYWFWYCDNDKNGLCYWDGSDHSGMDNQRRRLGYMDVNRYEGVDLNCYLVRELDAMAEIATALHKPEEAADFAKQAAVLRQKIDEVFWDESDGFYYDRDERTGKLNKVKSIAGFMPLWCKAASPQRAERLVKEHLINEDEFWLKYPIATWSKSEPDYCLEERGMCNWMGSVWVPTNYMVFRGLIDYGYTEIARELADKTFSLVVSEVVLREFYNGENGNGLGRNPFWGWSSLGYLMKAELECGFCHSDVKNETFITLEGFCVDDI